MNYFILDKNVTINNIEHSNFLNVVEINQQQCNVNVSNTEVYFTVPIFHDDISKSLNSYFEKNIEV